MLLNVPTLFVALFAAFAMFGVTLAVARPSLPDCPEVGIWTGGTWLTIAGFALLVSRAVGPEWLAIIGGNSLLFAGLHLNAAALNSFVLKRSAPWWQLALMILGIAGAVLLVGQPLPLRTVVASLLFALQLAPMVALLVTRGWSLEPSLRTVGIALGFTMAALLVRAVHAWLHPGEYTGYFQASFGNGLTYLASYLFPLGAGIGFILANLERTAAKLRKAATHDSLTGCIGRGPFEAMLKQACERAQREGKALSLLLMDLDSFKAINDAHGHEGGDEVLRRFTRAVQSRLRASDILGRVGGEEFAVILPATGAAGAATIAEELRRVTEALDVPAPQGARIAVTVSVGAAAVEAGAAAQAHDALYGQADSALYASKRAGRNRTTSFSAGQGESGSADAARGLTGRLS